MKSNLSQNIFTTQEVLISCSSLRKINIDAFKAESEEPKYFVSDNFSYIIFEQIKKDVKKNSKRIANNVRLRNPNATQTELVVNILLNRRYRRGKKEDNNAQMIHDKVESYINRSKPIQLTISLFPCKIPNRLKTAGSMPDFAEVISLARLAEISNAIKQIYKPGAQFIVLTDGKRFQNILNFEPEIIKLYQLQLKNMLSALDVGDTVILFDYIEFLHTNLPKNIITEKNIKYKKLLKEYVDLVGSQLPKSNIGEYFEQLKQKSKPNGTVYKIIDLYYSLLYSNYISEIDTNQDPDQLTKQVYSNLFEFNHPNKMINKLRKKIVFSTWKSTIKYVAEIASGRIAKPVEAVFPDSIRCDMHNIQERLTLYAVDRSTTLTAFHGTGFLNKRNELNVRFRVSLQHENFSPVYGKMLGLDYNSQPLFYCQTELASNSFLPISVARLVHIRK